MQSPSWEANRFAASPEILRISRNPKVHYRTHKRPPPVSILGQPNPVHIPTSHLLEIHPNIIHPPTPKVSPVVCFPPVSPPRPYTRPSQLRHIKNKIMNRHPTYGRFFQFCATCCSNEQDALYVRSSNRISLAAALIEVSGYLPVLDTLRPRIRAISAQLIRRRMASTVNLGILQKRKKV